MKIFEYIKNKFKKHSMYISSLESFPVIYMNSEDIRLSIESICYLIEQTNNNHIYGILKEHLKDLCYIQKLRGIKNTYIPYEISGKSEINLSKIFSKKTDD